MMGMLDDLEKRIDQERAEAQQKKLQEAQKKAAEEAEKARKKAAGDDNHTIL